MSEVQDRIDEIVEATGCGCEIAEDAVQHGYTPVFVADNGKFGNQRIVLYDCGDVRAIDTNGGAVWEPSTDGDEWDKLMDQLDE